MREKKANRNSKKRLNTMSEIKTEKHLLVTTEWAANHLQDEGIRFVEVDVNTRSYDSGHIPGAAGWNWQTQLQDQLRRTIVSKEDFEQLLSETGIDNDTTIILYGDNNNWFAAWAFWQLKIYGHEDVKIMNGGRKKWMAEGRELSTEKPQPEQKSYSAEDPDKTIRSLLPDVQVSLSSADYALVDVRSNDEFTGKILAPPGLPETCQRGGHIPGAKNIPWAMACNEDGTFKSAEELRKIYAEKGITPDKNVIAYCRIGERSSHSWFVLKYLLGFPTVTNYDGSWTEWGNLVGAPVEK